MTERRDNGGVPPQALGSLIDETAVDVLVATGFDRLTL
jgi:hypothetical protein